MKYNPHIHHPRSIRLPGFDYGQSVRVPKHLEHIRNYIGANPSHWQDDPEYSQYALINDYDLPF